MITLVHNIIMSKVVCVCVCVLNLTQCQEQIIYTSYIIKYKRNDWLVWQRTASVSSLLIYIIMIHEEQSKNYKVLWSLKSPHYLKCWFLNFGVCHHHNKRKCFTGQQNRWRTRMGFQFHRVPSEFTGVTKETNKISIENLRNIPFVESNKS